MHAFSCGARVRFRAETRCVIFSRRGGTRFVLEALYGSCGHLQVDTFPHYMSTVDTDDDSSREPKLDVEASDDVSIENSCSFENTDLSNIAVQNSDYVIDLDKIDDSILANIKKEPSDNDSSTLRRSPRKHTSGLSPVKITKSPKKPKKSLPSRSISSSLPILSPKKEKRGIRAVRSEAKQMIDASSELVRVVGAMGNVLQPPASEPHSNDELLAKEIVTTLQMITNLRTKFTFKAKLRQILCDMEEAVATAAEQEASSQ